MLVKFTTKGKATLVNVNCIVGVRKDMEQKSNTWMSKIYLTTGLMVFVDEEMNEIHKIVNGALNKTHEIDYSYDVPSVDEKFQSQYQNDLDNDYQPRPYRPRQKYNNERY